MLLQNDSSDKRKSLSQKSTLFILSFCNNIFLMSILDSICKAKCSKEN